MANEVHPIFSDILAGIAPKARKVNHSYFVVMIDYGKPYPGKKGPSGLEAVVDPEITRREVVSRLKDGNYSNVVFIHHVEAGLVEDVTAELIDEAETQAREDAHYGLRGEL